MNSNVIIHGPQGCGKSSHAAEFWAYFHRGRGAGSAV